MIDVLTFSYFHLDKFMFDYFCKIIWKIKHDDTTKFSKSD